MTDDGSYLRRQFKTAWSLTDLHLTGLDTEECLWRPASQGNAAAIGYARFLYAVRR